jgi:hypothetical protein
MTNKKSLIFDIKTNKLAEARPKGSQNNVAAKLNSVRVLGTQIRSRNSVEGLLRRVKFDSHIA